MYRIGKLIVFYCDYIGCCNIVTADSLSHHSFVWQLQKTSNKQSSVVVSVCCLWCAALTLCTETGTFISTNVRCLFSAHHLYITGLLFWNTVNITRPVIRSRRCDQRLLRVKVLYEMLRQILIGGIRTSALYITPVELSSVLLCVLSVGSCTGCTIPGLTDNIRGLVLLNLMGKLKPGYLNYYLWYLGLFRHHYIIVSGWRVC